MDAFLEDGSHEATIAVIRALMVAVPHTTERLRDYILNLVSEKYMFREVLNAKTILSDLLGYLYFLGFQDLCNFVVNFLNLTYIFCRRFPNLQLCQTQ